MPKFKPIATSNRIKGKKQTKVGISRHFVDALADLVQKLSSIEYLPTEVFQLILSNLGLYSHLACTFVSKAISSKVRDMKHDTTIYSNAEYRRWAYNSTVCQLEAKGFPRKKLTHLTCYRCGNLKDNSMTGFADMYFKKSRQGRKCIICMHRPIIRMKVGGEEVIKCAARCEE